MFIPNEKPTRVKLLKDCQIMAGTFTKGHIFKVTSQTERGYDLIDADGNELLECASTNFKVIK